MQRVFAGILRKEHIGQEVLLKGWVFRRRDHGGLVFIDLRDRSGIVQIVFSQETSKTAHTESHKLRSEYVIAVKGKVRRRPEETLNPDLPTGEVEVYVTELELLNVSQTPAFTLEETDEVNEDLRLKYRFLDLRRSKMFNNLYIRHKICQATRRYFDEQGFIEVETPFLTKSTPEGARDFLVPCRLNPGTFYALPQSPQLFKQILMVSGFERYFQIVKCFRDEDLRADRQPEFTQIDVEMSFINEEDIFNVIEGVLKEIYKAALSIEIETPFPRYDYEDVMLKYGNDKPDLRFGLEIKDVTDISNETEFSVFKDAIHKGGVVRGLCIPCGNSFSRKDIDDLIARSQQLGASGLAWFRLKDGELTSNITKYFTSNVLNKFKEIFKPDEGDVIGFIADKEKVVCTVLSQIRFDIGARLNLIDNKKLAFLWVKGFPLFEWDEKEKRYVAVHHPFTSPRLEDIEFLTTDPSKVRARAYDIVLNGVEIGGGSIRIHRQDIQSKVF
ncbi:MAG: aspartate--tRNA ligase, partial [Candidatus Hydrogenedentota bacterium]